MKRLVVTLVVLLALLLVADRAGAALASRAVATQVQTVGAAAAADVEIGGFPFLTQAIAGRYDEVVVVARDVPARDLTVARLEATLRGVEVPLSQALSGSVQSVPVAGVDATALLAYDELARRAGREVTVAPAGDRVRVTGSVQVLGQTVSATALSRVEVVGGEVVVTAESFEVGNAAADEAVTRALGDRLDLRIPVAGLPYGLQVTGVDVQPEGVLVRAQAGATVLSPA